MTLEMDIKRREQLSREEGREEGIKATAIEMLKQKLDLAVIAKCTKLSVEEIKEIAKELD